MKTITTGLVLICALSSVALAEDAREPYFGLRLAQRDGGKVEVTYADPTGLASRIGLKKGDIVTHFQGQPIRKTDQLLKALTDIQPGKKKPVTVYEKVVTTKNGVTTETVVARTIEVDQGDYRFEISRPADKSTESKVFAGKVKVYDESTYKKIKDAFPEAPIKVGTYYIAPKK